MNLGLRARVVAFAAGFLTLFALILWAALASWDLVGRLRERLNVVNLESFRIADHFQREILLLNDAIMDLEIGRDPRSWADFQSRSETLDRWIDQEKPGLRSESELALLNQIDHAYDDFKSEAGRLASNRLSTGVTGDAALRDLGRLGHETERLVNLAHALADAHRDSLNQFLERSNRSLLLLRNVIVGALVLVAVSGVAMAALVYQRLIQPLQSRLVEAQASAERHEKLASLGVLAAGVAHEIRNPLTAIKARAFILQRRNDSGTPDRDAADVIAGEITRLERIVKDFLAFAKPSEPALAPVRIGQLLNSVSTLLAAPLAQSGVVLEQEDSPSIAVRADVDQIRQVLINLVQNAADASSARGIVRLRARTGHERLGNGQADVGIIEVEDHGSGIPRDVQKRLFDPFFTTKPSGTGLGLSIASKIVEAHGGRLQYQTQPGRGTTFTIILPLATEAAGSAA